MTEVASLFPFGALQALHEVFHFNFLCERNNVVLWMELAYIHFRSPNSLLTSYISTTASTLILGGVAVGFSGSFP